MEVYKFKRTKGHSDLPEDTDFFDLSHGMSLHEWTLCSVAPEEWGYTQQTKVKNITCHDCLRQIKHALTYKGKL